MPKLRPSPLPLVVALALTCGVVSSVPAATVSLMGWKWCPTSGGTADIPYYFNFSCVGEPNQFLCLATIAAVKAEIDAVVGEYNDLATVLEDPYHLYPGGDLSGDCAVPDPAYGIVFEWVDLGNTFCGQAADGSASSCGLLSFLWDHPGRLGTTVAEDTDFNIFGLNEARLVRIYINSKARWTDFHRSETIRHEMGHALGLGHLMNGFGLMQEHPDCPKLTFSEKLIDTEAQQGIACIYGGLSSCPGEYFAIQGTPDETDSSQVAFFGKSCDCGSCPTTTAAVRAAGPKRTYELAVRDSGEVAYTPFATLSEGDWVNGIYRHRFSAAYRVASFRMIVTDGATTVGEAYSTYPIHIAAPVVSVPDRRSPGGYALNVFPSPSRRTANVEVDVPEDADLDLALFDVSGRRVATLFHGLLARGPHRFTWSGGEGAAHGGGVWFVVLRTPHGQVRRKLVVLF